MEKMSEIREFKPTSSKDKILCFPGLKIGKGAFGDVFYGFMQCHKKNRLVAVKSIGDQDYKPESNALNLLKDNENVVQIYDFITESFQKERKEVFSTRYFLLEFCNRGTLEDFINENNVSDLEKRVIFKQMVLTLKEIHDKNIMHRDIKPSNILFNEDIVKFVDFGECKELKQGEDITQTYKGTKFLMNPQQLKGQTYTYKGDIFTLGVTLYYMYYQRFPYFKCKAEQKKYVGKDGGLSKLYKKKLNGGEIDEIFTDEVYIDANGKDLIKGMLNLDEGNRLSLDEILKHDYMKFVKTSINSPKRIKMNFPKEIVKSKDFPEEARKCFEEELKRKYAREIMERFYYERNKALFINQVLKNIENFTEFCSIEKITQLFLALSYYNHLQIAPFYTVIKEKIPCEKIAKKHKWDAFYAAESEKYYKNARDLLEKAYKITRKNYEETIDTISKKSIAKEARFLLKFDEEIGMELYRVLQNSILEVMSEIWENLKKCQDLEVEKIIISSLYDYLLILTAVKSLGYDRKKKMINFEKFAEDKFMAKSGEIMKERLGFVMDRYVLKKVNNFFEES